MAFVIRKDPIKINYIEYIFFNQYRDLKFFYKECAGEQLLSPILTYDKMKTHYPTQIIDLRFKVDYIIPKKIKFFENFDENPNITTLYVILVKHKENEKISDGNKVSGVEVLQMTTLNLKDFMEKNNLKNDSMK